MNRTLSIYLDFVRIAAALVVFLGHTSFDRFVGEGVPLLWRLQDLGNDAVMAFFVLSGFVIAHVASERDVTLRQFLENRLARLYSVVVPALLVTIAVDHLAVAHDREPWSSGSAGDSAPFQYVRTLLFLNELWFSTVTLRFNTPFWSLGYEAWYYALFAAAHYMNGKSRYLSVCVIALIAGPKILLLMPVWLLGVLAYVAVKGQRIPNWAGWIMVGGSALGYFLFRLVGLPELLLDWSAMQMGEVFVREQLAWSKQFLGGYLVGALLFMQLVGLAAVTTGMEGLLRPVRRPVRHLASYTFALYLFHFPLLNMLSRATAEMNNGLFRAVAVIAASVVVVWAVGTFIERRRSSVAQAIHTAVDVVQRWAPPR